MTMFNSQIKPASKPQPGDKRLAAEKRKLEKDFRQQGYSRKEAMRLVSMRYT